MHRPAERRHALAWTLYASLLFALLQCGLGHGQAVGLTLNGVGGAFCGHAGATPGPVSFDKWLGDTLGGSTALDCPLCSHTGLACATRIVDLPVAQHSVQSPLPAAPTAGPRRLWPPANPRASPALI